MFFGEDALQVGVAAAALLLAFLLGYAVRSYASHRRRLRYFGPNPPSYPPDTTASTKSETTEMHPGHQLWKALVTIIAYGAVIGWMWFNFPACEKGQVAVFAPQSVSMWACAQGHLSALRPILSSLQPTAENLARVRPSSY
jgi:hypothetical protein